MKSYSTVALYRYWITVQVYGVINITKPVIMFNTEPYVTFWVYIVSLLLLPFPVTSDGSQHSLGDGYICSAYGTGS